MQWCQIWQCADERLDLFLLMLFFACLHAVGTLVSLLHPSCSLIGDMATGALLGPLALDLVPFPDAMLLLGKLGVYLLVTNGGMDADVRMLGRDAVRMVLGSLTGVILPLVATTTFMLLIGFDVTASVIGGAVLASTSAAIALAILEGRMHTRVAQLVAGSAMLDDICALVILAIISRLSGGGGGSGWPAVIAIVTPVLTSCGLLLASLGLWWLLPPAFDSLCDWRGRRPLATVCLLVWMAVLAFAAPLFGSSDLLGVFCAGLAFSDVTVAHEGWERHVHAAQSLLQRVFFATIGFSIPLLSVFQPWTILWGLLLTIIAAVTKMAVGLLALPAAWEAAAWGTAMVSKRYMLLQSVRMLASLSVCMRFSLLSILTKLQVARGELGMVIATSAQASGLLPPEAMAILVIPVMLCTFLAPIPFAMLVQKTSREAAEEEIAC